LTSHLRRTLNIGRTTLLLVSGDWIEV